MLNKINQSAIILAGGKSSRMGRDKALLPFGNQTLIEYLADLLNSIFSEVLIVVDDVQKCDGLKLGKAIVYKDLIANKGPLGGLYTGLFYTYYSRACVFTCDMPGINKDLIQKLIHSSEETDGLICFEDSNHKTQPFPGIYPKTCLNEIHSLIETDHPSMKQLIEISSVQLMPLSEYDTNMLVNMNTPKEYEQILNEREKNI